MQLARDHMAGKTEVLRCFAFPGCVALFVNRGVGRQCESTAFEGQVHSVRLVRSSLMDFRENLGLLPRSSGVVEHL